MQRHRRCRVELYWIKATALRAAAPGRARAGRAAWRPVPPQRAGQPIKRSGRSS